MPLSFNAQLAAARDAVNKFADLHFSGEIPVERRDESGVLAFTLNRLAKFYGKIAAFSNKTVVRLIQAGNVIPINQDKNAVVLFCNIRSFSFLAQDLRPKEKQELLNAFFQKISLCAQISGGYLDKIIGDKAMFHWGVLGAGSGRDNALSAIRAALMMRSYLGDWNKKRIAADLSPIVFSFGIDTGTANLSAFSVGGTLEYSLAGPAVDNAYHCMLRAKAARAEILLTENTHNLAAKFVIDGEADTPAHSRETNERLFALVNIREKTATARLLKDLAQIPDIDLATAVTFAGPRGPKTLTELRTALHITTV
jgi:class 3 adenylate cyclase